MAVSAALAVGALTLGWARGAAAETTVSASLYGLYGDTLVGGDPVDPFGLGVALEAGVTLPGSLYIGGSLLHFFGVEIEEHLPIGGGSPIAIRRTGMQTRLAAVIGYTWDLVAVTLRPSLGLGLARVAIEREEAQAPVIYQSRFVEPGWAISPGVELRVPLGALAFCAELRNDTLIMDGADPSALVFGVGLGLDF